jgi:hypothetical protein
MTSAIKPARVNPGRKLPTTLADFTCERLAPQAAELILELVKLMVTNVGGFKQLAEEAHHSTADLARPKWAIGTPGDDSRARICSQQLSKALGKGARKAPDWATVAWVLQLCVPDDQRATTTANMAALWRQATVAATPVQGDNTYAIGDKDNIPRDNRGTAGDIVASTGDNVRRSSSNDNVAGGGDFAVMASRLAERDRQVQAVMDQVKAMGDANAELRARLLQSELDLRQERGNNQRTQQALGAALNQLKAEYAAAVETHGRQLEHAVNNGRRRTKVMTTQLETARHHAAVLAAHTYVTHNHDQRPTIDLETLLPIPGIAGLDLKMDAELRTMLNPSPKLKATNDQVATSYVLDARRPDRTITTWLRAYVRALLGQTHPEGLFTVFGADQAGQIDAFINGGPLPSRDTLRALIRTHPDLSTYLPALINAATNPDKPDRAVLVPIPDDLLDASTPPVKSTRHNTTLEFRQTQVTVAELYARGDVYKEVPGRGDNLGDNPGDDGDNARTV